MSPTSAVLHGSSPAGRLRCRTRGVGRATPDTGAACSPARASRARRSAWGRPASETAPARAGGRQHGREGAADRLPEAGSTRPWTVRLPLLADATRARPVTATPPAHGPPRGRARDGATSSRGVVPAPDRRPGRWWAGHRGSTCAPTGSRGAHSSAVATRTIRNGGRGARPPHRHGSRRPRDRAEAATAPGCAGRSTRSGARSGVRRVADRGVRDRPGSAVRSRWRARGDLTPRMTGLGLSRRTGI
jgi:hypothetical protein